MQPRGWRRVLLLAVALLLPLVLHAAEAIPRLTQHVTDLTGTLTTTQVGQLDAQLRALEKTKGAQVIVLMVPTTGDQDIESYTLAVAEANQVGRKGIDDGLLLLVAKDDRRVRYEVGYGLEGAIPDAATARITREYLAPKFRNNDYFGGISDALGALTGLIRGEALPAPVRDTASEAPAAPPFQHGLMVATIAALFLRSLVGRASPWIRAPLGAVLVGGLLWLMISLGAGLLGALLGAVLMLLPASGGRFVGPGGWGGFGGFGGGGGSGGGFSGGGGRFGGGGSTGSW